ncbi:cyclic nucleotide-binding domain protein (macronuclear) [Tetrahymena thermophila SB210]|uniref:Cyclic nucleotide-binding domain protein n=1 Tax=Tetrahymena thermophila (strain SB210) TaxID=312017 RepID=I7MI34_TETTS|nr:cyclic nucleotide-binding domain protein [Tetrahymena thermophila SB210]EAR90833.2 cyclic nucleotide-binding domain protein [Tetrahymena thermophila SB210]|eukprot:XP_001011078.2 cyclic nucleotide-binding domain protein [Tetrahymena thermophila SB210]
MSLSYYDKLVVGLQKNPKERTPSDLIRISQEIENVNFLKQFIGTNTPEFLEMCQFLKLEEYPSDHILFQQGDLGDKYYIIVKGKVQISINIPQGKGKNQTFKLKEVGQIGIGMSFGELALLFNSIRNATIKTIEQSAFIVLTKDIFSNYMKFKTPPNAEEILKFFDQLESFQEQKLALPQKIQIVSKCDTKNYVSNAAIVLQGKPVDSLSFIKKGLTKVYRKVKFKVNTITGEIDPKDCSDPSEFDIQNGYFKELFLEIDEIYEGNLISEYELLNYKPSYVSILAYTPTEIISINRNDLQILPEKLIDQFKSSSKPYPPDSKLRKVFFQGLHWKNFRIDVVDNMNIDSRNKKNIVNKKIMDREQPYQIPIQATLHVDEDSFNKELEENDDDLEKQVFKPLDKLFNNQKENKILQKLSDDSQNLKDSKSSELKANQQSPAKFSFMSASQRISPIKNNRKSACNINLKPIAQSKAEKLQLGDIFANVNQPSLNQVSKSLLPPIMSMLSLKQSISRQDHEDPIFETNNQIKFDKEQEKYLIRRQLYKTLDPKKEIRNSLKNNKINSFKIEDYSGNESNQLSLYKKENKIVLHRYVTPKLNHRSLQLLKQQDVILTERPKKIN